MSNLKMFVVDIREDEYAILIFAENKIQAEELSLSVMIADGGNTLDLSAREWLKEDHEWTWNRYYPADGKPCVIDYPEACELCEKFGMEIGQDGLCHECRKQIEKEIEVARREIICPDCNGSGEVLDGINEYGEPCISRCSECEGSGNIFKYDREA